MEDPAVKKFVEVYDDVQQKLDQGDIDAARKSYLELHGLYENINTSPLEHVHKELAFDTLTKLRARLESQATPSRGLPASVFIFIGVALMAVSFLILAEPSLVGFTVLEQSLGQSTELGVSFTASTEHIVTLQEVPTSLRLSGKLTSGTARVSAVINDERIVIFDSERVPLIDGVFGLVCLESCSIRSSTSTIPLIIDVSGGTLRLDKLTYDITHSTNKLPEWRGRQDFDLSGSLTIDLKNYFFDPDGDPLLYLSTVADGLEVTVTGSSVEIKNVGASGERSLTFLASDTKDVTRVPVTIQVK